MERKNDITPYVADETRYDTMLYRRVGKSGLKMSAVSLGFWHNFGGYDSYENCRAIVRRAFDKGITVFDLANNYGPPVGSAEETFGRLMKEDMHPYRDEMVITTKAGFYMHPGPYGDWGSRKYLLSSLDRSLQRMGLDYVDIFYHHRSDPETPLEETMGALATAVKSGKALYVGISNYSPEEAERAAQILDSMGVHCLICQSRYNLLDRHTEKLFPTAEKCGFGMTAYSPLAQGVLTGKYNHGIPAGSRADGKSVFLNKNSIKPEMIEKVSRLEKIAERRGQTMTQFALSWILREKTMASVLIGASRPEQIDEDVKCLAKLDFSAEELSEIDSIVGTV
ncbi:MAG: L-glyceraldehyde 3-phosphate reductase [Thermocaproicibacter melissae]|jgi:L-glyceraldehyde 3-phosphate reductase|uniref:aldo/keto reductase n=1 Tax=Thermocaproicibacter melissae TaxID=2966552 RepID=UPI0024B0AB08|nr:aldo/keto reductase [Thermocaproicibacter melissae]WBY64371.1 aldo/keto reductase [Thermocaproicibacter melissae]